MSSPKYILPVPRLWILRHNPRTHTRTIIDDEPEMLAAILVRRRGFHQVDELSSMKALPGRFPLRAKSKILP